MIMWKELLAIFFLQKFKDRSKMMKFRNRVIFLSIFTEVSLKIVRRVGDFVYFIELYIILYYIILAFICTLFDVFIISSF